MVNIYHFENLLSGNRRTEAFDDPQKALDYFGKRLFGQIPIGYLGVTIAGESEPVILVDDPLYHFMKFSNDYRWDGRHIVYKRFARCDMCGGGINEGQDHAHIPSGTRHTLNPHTDEFTNIIPIWQCPTCGIEHDEPGLMVKCYEGHNQKELWICACDKEFDDEEIFLVHRKKCQK